MSTNRIARYLRVSLLSVCNLKCSYCRPQGNIKPLIAAPDEKVRSAIEFLYRFGVRKIRFTGGEPTLSKNLNRLIAYTKEIDGGIHTAVTSNGILLKSMAKKLAEAGLDSVNISIDTLDTRKFHSLTKYDRLNDVISGIDAAVEHIGNVKLNCVLIRGVNDDEIDKLISFSNSRGLSIRFIEFMPNRFSSPGDPRYISSKDIRNQLPWNLKAVSNQPGGAARYFSSPSLKIKIGFISSVSHPFCDSCDRIRLTADGMLYTCLYDSKHIDLYGLLSENIETAGSTFKSLMKTKQFCGCKAKTDGVDDLPSFSAIGG